MYELTEGDKGEIPYVILHVDSCIRFTTLFSYEQHFMPRPCRNSVIRTLRTRNTFHLQSLWLRSHSCSKIIRRIPVLYVNISEITNVPSSLFHRVHDSALHSTRYKTFSLISLFLNSECIFGYFHSHSSYSHSTVLLILEF